MRGDLLWSCASSPAIGFIRPGTGGSRDEPDPGRRYDGGLRSPGPGAALRMSVVHRPVRLVLPGLRSVRCAPAIVVHLGREGLQLDLPRVYRGAGDGPDAPTACPGRYRVRSPVVLVHGYRSDG